MRVHLKTLGCRLNEAELESWARGFQARGFAISADSSDCDLVVVNTCAVTAEAVRKSRKLIRRTHRDSPRAKLVMSGCYASLDPAQAAAELGVDLVVANPDKERLVQIVTRELDLPTMPAMATEPGAQALLSRNRQRAFIKVQDGCRYRCSYCIVTIARGEERSKPIDEIVDEINQLHDGGIHEVVLAGVHLGGYGSDAGSSLQQLVKRVLQETRIPRIRLGSLEPWELPQEFWSLFSNPRLMPHLHLPLQSGADSVLRRMSRRCRTGDFLDLIGEARRRVENFSVTTDIIVGFPGETESEWQQTMDLVEKAGFTHVHIFAYSAREGTKAATLPDSIPREIKRQRSEQLHELAESSRRGQLQHFIGKTFDVLVEARSESQAGESLWSGYTPNYLRIEFPGGEQIENSIVPVLVEGVSADSTRLMGRLLDWYDNDRELNRPS